MRHAGRLLALGILVLAARLAVDVATPLLPGAFVLTPAGIDGAAAWSPRVEMPAAPEPADDDAGPTPMTARVPVVTTARPRPASPPRRVERPLRIPGHGAPVRSPSDASADH